MNEELLLYSLINTFSSVLKIDVSSKTLKYLKSKKKDFSKLSSSEKMHYSKYSLEMSNKINDYLKKITFFELNTESDSNIVHDFRLTWGKDKIAYVSMCHKTININNLIPNKLMKICKYKRNTKICKAYEESYNEINLNGYNKIKSKVKYSKISAEKKSKYLLQPICNLVHETLSKKRKCAQHFYNHLFNESERIVFKVYKDRFIMYDFDNDVSQDVESYRMKVLEDNVLEITFSNNVKFNLTLRTNATEIKEHLSLKFVTKLENLDELFEVARSKKI